MRDCAKAIRTTFTSRKKRRTITADTARHRVRIASLRAQLVASGADAFISTFGPHLRYFAGFSGSNGLLVVARDAAVFVTDYRYSEQSAREVTACRRIITRENLTDVAAKRGVFAAMKTVVFEPDTCSYGFIDHLRVCAPQSALTAVETIASRCMVSKDEQEIASLQRAVSITDRVFTDLLGLIRPGVSELEIASEVVARHRRYGAEQDAFDVIVASGGNGSMPHARPSSRIIKTGDFVTIDFGCVVDGYHSDMTRTIAVGRVTREMRRVYAAVLEAQRSGIEAACAGITGRALDRASRRVIARYGYGKYFVHGLGHGIGLQIHEEPRVSKTNNDPLPAGAVVTIEPGIYLPGVLGVRIEDDVVLRSAGCDVLTASPKELIIL